MKKKFFSTALVFAMTAMLFACGAQETETDSSSEKETTLTPEATKAPDVTKEPEATKAPDVTKTAEHTSTDLYMDFLAGKEKVFTERKEFNAFNCNIEQIEVDVTSGMTITDMMKWEVAHYSSEEFQFLLFSLNYAIIDCGADGEPELALDASFYTSYDELYEFQYIIKNFDGRLQLCEILESYYRSYETLANIYGLEKGSGSFGATSHYYGSGYIDANGDFIRVYGAQEIVGGTEELDERFQEFITEEMAARTDIYLNIYDFEKYTGENADEFYAKRIYCAEPRLKDDFEGLEDNIAMLQTLFDMANVKLYSREELSEAVAQREAEAGLTDTIKNGDAFEWISCDINLVEINGAGRE